MGNIVGFAPDKKGKFDELAKQILGFGSIMAERTKLKSEIAANRLKAKDNYMFKLLEQKSEQENKLKMMDEMQKRFGQQNGLGQEEGGLVDPSALQKSYSSSGGVGFRTPSAEQQRINARLGLEQIKRMEAAGISLSPQQQAFKDKWGWMAGGQKDAPQSKQFEENIKVKLSQGQSLNPDEINYYNKFMWRTGNEMQSPKKDKFGYTVGQEYKGYKYIGNNKWQR